MFDISEPNGNDWNLMISMGVVNNQGAMPMDSISFNGIGRECGSCFFTNSEPNTRENVAKNDKIAPVL